MGGGRDRLPWLYSSSCVRGPVCRTLSRFTKRSARPPAFALSEKCPDDRSELFGGGHEAQVTVLEDVESGIGYEPRHNPAVETRHDRVVAARQDQGRLRQPVQP